MSVVGFIPVDHIARRGDVRPLDEGVVTALVQSIDAVGLVNPITVRALDNDRYEVIAGSHRLAAHERLGRSEILCLWAEDADDLHAELAMIDENLCRAELSASDRSRQTARRKAIYEELHPETKHGAPGVSRKVGDSRERSSEAPRFSAETAVATGRSERSVQMDAERGEKVTAEALDLIRGTKLDTGAYLDKLKRLPADEQLATAKNDLATDRKPAATTRSATSSATSRSSSRSEGQGALNPPTTHYEYTRLIAWADEIGSYKADALVAGCPPRQRAALCQRLSSLIDLFTETMERATT